MALQVFLLAYQFGDGVAVDTEDHGTTESVQEHRVLQRQLSVILEADAGNGPVRVHGGGNILPASDHNEGIAFGKVADQGNLLIVDNNSSGTHLDW